MSTCDQFDSIEYLCAEEILQKVLQLDEVFAMNSSNFIQSSVFFICGFAIRHAMAMLAAERVRSCEVAAQQLSSSKTG